MCLGVSFIIIGVIITIIGFASGGLGVVGGLIIIGIGIIICKLDTLISLKNGKTTEVKKGIISNKIEPSEEIEVIKKDISIIPAYRISKNTKPEMRIQTDEKCTLNVIINKDDEEIKTITYNVIHRIPYSTFELELTDIIGDIDITFQLVLDDEVLYTKTIPYQIINSDVTSTKLIDGLWVSIYHWSEDEARLYNSDLKELTDEDWKTQIKDMNEAGIKGVIINQSFICNEYVNQHEMDLSSYSGKAFYDSKIYEGRMDIAAKNPIEAILSAADEYHMHVFIAVGHYAWFDFSRDSLDWHISITKELYILFGHHDSFYGWYVSEELFGDLYYSYEPVPNNRQKEIIYFFSVYNSFIRNLTPTKPIAFAISNTNFGSYKKQWKRILRNIDILLPFGFARDAKNMNIDEIAEVCKECKTHLWLDMEVFKYPLDEGLMPKTGEELIKEIRTYDMVEQIFGYQYTGLMNNPESCYTIGREDTKKLYNEYKEYYLKAIEENNKEK